MSSYRMGDLITFTYPVHKEIPSWKIRTAAEKRMDTRAHERHPEVLVLHDNWQGLVHGLAFQYLTDDEIRFVKAILNEDLAEQLGEKYPFVGRQLQKFVHVYDNLNITSPHQFYLEFIKPFIKQRDFDPYRRYRPDRMSAVRVLVKREILTGEKKEGVFGKFVNKFQNMRGSRFRGGRIG